MDRSGAMPVVVSSIFVYIISMIILGFSAWWIGAVVIGAAVMDCGIRGAIVANQTLVAGVDADARNRSNTIFGAHNWGQHNGRVSGQHDTGQLRMGASVRDFHCRGDCCAGLAMAS